MPMIVAKITKPINSTTAVNRRGWAFVGDDASLTTRVRDAPDALTLRPWAILGSTICKCRMDELLMVRIPFVGFATSRTPDTRPE